jgi:hypothetical protein
MAGNDTDKNKELNDKLGELESYMTQKPPVLKELNRDFPEIPILDELVVPQQNNESRDTHDVKEEDERSIDDIAERVEEKLSTELDEIVTLLKDTLKNSIMTELQGKINKDTDKDSDS